MQVKLKELPELVVLGVAHIIAMVFSLIIPVIGAMPILLNAAFAPIHWAKRAIDRKHNEEFDF
jgi:hypothetical protein